MNKVITIELASEFSKYPSGRTNGKFNGTIFREQILWPYLSSNETEKVIVKLDGILMRGSSFFEESFGGLIRVNNMELSNIKNKLEIIYKIKPSFVNQIWKYIEEADRANNNNRK